MIVKDFTEREYCITRDTFFVFTIFFFSVRIPRRFKVSKRKEEKGENEVSSAGHAVFHLSEVFDDHADKEKKLHQSPARDRTWVIEANFPTR